MTKCIGKGKWGSLTWLCIKNNNNIIVEIHITRENIEKAIIEHNTNHFKKVLNTKAFKDKIHNQLENNKIRDKILEGKLQRKECNNDNTYQLL